MAAQTLKVTKLPATTSIAAAFADAAQQDVLKSLLNDLQLLRNTVDAMVTGLSTVGVQGKVTVTDPAAKAAGVDDVHAGVQADSALAFTGSFTDPDVPRNLRVKFATDWDGGDVTVYGTDQFDRAISETFTGASNVTRTGSKAFKTTVSAVHTIIGEATATVVIGVGDKLGITKKLVGTSNAVLTAEGTPESVTLDATYHTMTPTTTPDGATEYILTADFDPSNGVGTPSTVSTGA